MSFITQDNSKTNKEISQMPPTNTIKENIELQLGDVIHITNPTNDRLNDQTFIIDYLDKTKIMLINTETLDTIQLKIYENGVIGDGTITELDILSRSDKQGYARQNNLLPGTWIDIHFSGDFPAIITGEITNLENDMIEIRTIDNDTLYLNFDYKGVPEDLPISLIEIREQPTIQKDQMGDQDLEKLNIDIDELEEDLPENLNMEKNAKIEIGVPVINIKNQIREFIFNKKASYKLAFLLIQCIKFIFF
jgi:hypothetical protein